MLVFIIHGINTQNSRYADNLISNIHKTFSENKNSPTPIFYSSFWGNLFNDKKQKIIGNIKKDFSRACTLHPKIDPGYHKTIYRYREQRYKFINNFLGDFLIYQNPVRGKAIRETLLNQINQFVKSYPNEKEIHFITHSLGSQILWDLLFSNTLPIHDSAFDFRNIVKNLNLASISTMGSPLLFFKEMFDLDFNLVNNFVDNSKVQKNKYGSNSYKLRWVNIIHSSDLVGYPLKDAIESELDSKILISDQYVWQNANSLENFLLISQKFDAALVVGAEDAHSSYFAKNIDGRITGRIITSNLLGDTNRLLTRCVIPE